MEHGGEAFLEELVYQWELIRMTQVCDACDGFGFRISYIDAQMAQRYNTTETEEPCEDCNSKGRIELE